MSSPPFRPPLSQLTPSALNRTGFPQNSKKRAFYSPSSSASSTPRGPRRRHDTMDTSSPLKSEIGSRSHSSTPSLSSRRATLKRSFGVLNLERAMSGVEMGENERKLLDETTTPVSQAPVPVSRAYHSEERTSHRIDPPSYETGNYTMPAEAFTRAPAESPFVNPAHNKKPSSSTLLWKNPPPVEGGGEKRSRHRDFLVSPSGLPSRSFHDAVQESPSRHRRCQTASSLGPLDRAPLTGNSSETFIAPASFNSVKPLQTAFNSTGLQSKKSLNRGNENQRTMPATPCKRFSTGGLQSCIMRFTNEFDDTTAGGVNTSIFSETYPPQGQGRSGGPSTRTRTRTRTRLNLNVHLPPPADEGDTDLLMHDPHHDMTSSDMDEDIDLDKIDELHFDGFESIADLPPTPTKKNSISNSPSKPPKRASQLNVETDHPLTPVLSETAPRTPVECVLGLSQQSGRKLPALLAVNSLAPPSNSVQDPCLVARFGNCRQIGIGEFSVVYETSYHGCKYAVKRTKRPIAGPKTRMRKLEEVEILRMLSDSENEKPVLHLADYWEFHSYLYIMTEFCENGSLERFLAENGKVSRLDEWRVWKIMVELLQGVQYIHSKGILHLDLKPANILITFEGSLKIGDFGVASKMPIPPYFDREGDREYIAPEVISRHMYGTAADMFSCGLIMVEIAANIVLPDNGTSWQKLRSGDLTDAGRLSSSDLTDLEGSLFSTAETSSNNSSVVEDATVNKKPSIDNVLLNFARARAPLWAPYWYQDGSTPLDKVVAWMIDPNPGNRPSAAQVLKSYECSVVELRRKSGATIYEGDYGPRVDEAEIAEESRLLAGLYRISRM